MVLLTISHLQIVEDEHQDFHSKKPLDCCDEIGTIKFWKEAETVFSSPLVDTTTFPKMIEFFKS